MLPFKSLPAIVFGIYGSMSGGQEINLAAYVAITGILLLLSIGFVILLYKFVLRPDVSPILNSRECMEFDEQLSPYQKTILWSFVGLIVLLLFPECRTEELGNHKTSQGRAITVSCSPISEYIS